LVQLVYPASQLEHWGAIQERVTAKSLNGKRLNKGDHCMRFPYRRFARRLSRHGANDVDEKPLSFETYLPSAIVRQRIRNLPSRRGSFAFIRNAPMHFRSMPFWFAPTIFAADVGALMAIAEAVRWERDCDERMRGGPR
jgi:hypothetical protein